MTKIKVILFSLFIFLLLLPSVAAAFEDTVERYPNGVISDYWTLSNTNGYNPAIYAQGSGNHVIKFETFSTAYANSKITGKTNDYTGYLSFTVNQLTATSSGTSNVIIAITFTGGTTTTIYPLDHAFTTSYTETNQTYEIITSGGRLIGYKNGVSLGDLGACPSGACKIAIATQVGAGSTKSTMYIDDISTEGSSTGTSKTFSELDSSIWYTHRIQAYSSYPNSVYQIKLYSLTAANAGLINTETISTQAGTTALNRANLLGTNYGLYMLELTRDSDVLKDTYFYYYQSAYPQGLPEQLFQGTSSVDTSIYDEDSHGGEITGGESIYLYPNLNTPADYTFTYNILETPYAISTGLNTVYNTSSINSIKLDYSGLSSMSYNVSVDGAAAGQTGGADTYTHTFTGAGLTNPHVIAFSPDYSATGVWGVVKDSVTQIGIKSATVSVTGTNYGKTIYTDDNGLYYLTNGITAGQAYTILVSKPGYTTPPSQVATAQAGATTRQDFFCDPIATTSGAGLYYAPHDVAFTVLEYWYSGAGLTGVPYSIAENGTVIKTGSTDSKGMFTGSNMSGGTNYTIVLTHNGTTYTEYVEPSLSEYTFALNKEGILHEYYNSWLNLSYTETNGSIAIAYVSNKTLSTAAVTVTAANGTNIISESKTDPSGSFNFNLSSGDYTIKFNIEAEDGSTASQFWTLSSPPEVTLFPASYPTWLKNILYVGIIMIFLLAFGKSKNDVACGSAAVLVSLGYYFHWLSCGFNFVVLIWIIAIGAIYLHYKRTGALG